MVAGPHVLLKVFKTERGQVRSVTLFKPAEFVIKCTCPVHVKVIIHTWKSLTYP